MPQESIPHNRETLSLNTIPEDWEEMFIRMEEAYPSVMILFPRDHSQAESWRKSIKRASIKYCYAISTRIQVEEGGKLKLYIWQL